MASRAAAARTSTPPPGGVVIQNFNDPNTPETAPAEAPTFWERIYSITPDQWSQYICYLYRGKESLTKINHPFDPEWVQQNFGGGDYRAILNDEKYKLVASHSFSIAGPPRSVQPVQASAPAPSVDSFQAQVLQLIAENNKQTQDLIREVITQVRTQSAAPAAAAGGTEVIPIALRGVVDMFTSMMPKQQSPLEMLTALKGLMQPAQQPMDVITLLAKMKELGMMGAAAPGGDILSQLDNLLAVSEKLGGRGGKDGGVVQILAEKAPEIVDKLGGIVQSWAKVAEANRAVEQMRFERARVVPVVQPAAATLPGPIPSPAGQVGSVAGLEVEPVSEVNPAAHPGAQFVPAPQPGAAGAPAGVAVDEIDRMKHKIVEAISKGKTGADIVSFLDVVDDRLVDSFVNVPAPDLIQFFMMDPILNGATKLPRFNAVIAEIVEELNAVEEDELETAKPN